MKKRNKREGRTGMEAGWEGPLGVVWSGLVREGRKLGTLSIKSKKNAIFLKKCKTAIFRCNTYCKQKKKNLDLE